MWFVLAAAASYMLGAFTPSRLFAPDGRDIWPRPRIPLRLYAPDGVDREEGAPWTRRIYAPDGVDLDPDRGEPWRESVEELSQEGIRWQNTWGPSLSPDVVIAPDYWPPDLWQTPKTFAPNGRDLRFEALQERMMRVATPPEPPSEETP